MVGIASGTMSVPCCDKKRGLEYGLPGNVAERVVMLEQNLLPLEEGDFLERLLDIALRRGLLKQGNKKDDARIAAFKEWIADRDERHRAHGT